MTSSPWLTTLIDRLAGRDPSARRHTLFTLATAQFYAVAIGVMYHASALGLLPWPVAHGLAMAMVLAFLLFYTLVRSGWSQRFEDPVLTLPHAMVSTLITVAGYVLIGPQRGNVVLLMGQTIALSMFRLQPRETMFLGGWTVGWLSLAQIGLVLGGAPGFAGARALGHFIVCSAGLLALAVVCMWISAIRVRIVRQAQELRATLARAQELATTDMLTGLLNRRSMVEQLESALLRAERSGRPLSVALIDIDHFKRVNDVHGHRCGDEVLRGFAALAQADLRQVDKLARWGGEEFLLLMPHVEQGQAWVALDRLRQGMAMHPMGAQGSLSVTISAGVAQWHPGESMAVWLERADKAMYAAKQQGRNRCLVADSVSVAPAVLATVEVLT
jgi:diguanylate cyclase (GGDEF)-like protein